MNTSSFLPLSFQRLQLVARPGYARVKIDARFDRRRIFFITDILYYRGSSAFRLRRWGGPSETRRRRATPNQRRQIVLFINIALSTSPSFICFIYSVLA
jgi:hypothetical protein